MSKKKRQVLQDEAGAQEVDAQEVDAQEVDVQEVDAQEVDVQEVDVREVDAQEMSAEMQEALQSPAGRALLAIGEPLEEVWAYLHREQELERAREGAYLAALEQAQMRRPQMLAARGGGGASFDMAHMSEAALRQIDERLKRGEHVRL